MPVNSSMPKQTRTIYSLLLETGPLTAGAIAQQLNIFPHAVYRSTKLLKECGCIIERGNHPRLFEAVPVVESIEAYTLLQRDMFSNMFIKNSLGGKVPIEEVINIRFIESRDMLFETALSDIEDAKTEMYNLASGDELPAEIMLAQKRALERGVTIKTLFQKRNEINESYIQARIKMGEQIRITEALNSRIVIFDKRIVYVMSYDPSNYIKSMGIRFEYAPFGHMMSQLFLQYWDKGREL